MIIYHIMLIVVKYSDSRDILDQNTVLLRHDRLTLVRRASSKLRLGELADQLTLVYPHLQGGNLSKDNLLCLFKAI